MQRVTEATGAADTAHTLDAYEIIGSHFSFYSIFLKKHRMEFCSVAIITVIAFGYNMGSDNNF